MGFLLSRRWALFAVAVVVMTWGAIQLGQWQFHRLQETKHDNRVVATNLARPPVPITDVLAADRPPRASDEWLRVTVHGTWDDAHTVVLKYQTRDSGAGVDVVTPLVTPAGPAVLVDRGWLSTHSTGSGRPHTPKPTGGQVTVTGWVRQDATGSATKVSALTTRAVSSRAIATVTPYPLYRGFLDVAQESPCPATELEPTVMPDHTSNGPHFFYGLQWWFFGALAVFGFCYLAWDEFGQHRERRRSQRAQQPAVHRQHGAGDKG